MSTELENIFNSVSWERKFMHIVPRSYNEVWRESEAEEAQEILQNLSEETESEVNSLYLFEDSTGQKQALVSEDWDN